MGFDKPPQQRVRHTERVDWVASTGVNTEGGGAEAGAGAESKDASRASASASLPQVSKWENGGRVGEAAGSEPYSGGGGQWHSRWCW